MMTRLVTKPHAVLVPAEGKPTYFIEAKLPPRQMLASTGVREHLVTMRLRDADNRYHGRIMHSTGSDLKPNRRAEFLHASLGFGDRELAGPVLFHGLTPGMATSMMEWLTR